MNVGQQLKRMIGFLSAMAIGAIVIYIAFKQFPKADDLKYLPTESILKKQLQKDIELTINNALFNIMDASDFELAVHVNLNQDEITEELIKYEPKEIATRSLTKNLSPVPKVNALPGLIDNPFHNESLPGFPSYFDQFDIQKDDYATRGLFAKILSTAYQLPKHSGIVPDDLTIIDNNETEFGESVSTIVNEDILKLYRSGEFRPNDFLSKASLITALVRINYPTSNYYSKDVISDVPYKDIPRNHWAYNYVKIALENKLIEENILFNPNEKVTVETVLNLIEKTPLRSDIFNYYRFPKKDDTQLFKTDNKTEMTESNIYYNQEKTYYKSPSTKIKNISIRLMVNQMVIGNDISLENLEDIVRSVVDIDDNRNDSLIIKSFKFTNLPMLVRINKWQHWQKFYGLILFIILGFLITRSYKRYKKYQQNQHKINQLKKQKEEKLALIHEEEEEKSYQKIKREIIEDASKNTETFTLKLEKWLEMLQNSQAFAETPKEAYEKLAVVILFVDFERPGLSTKIIKSLHSDHVKDTIHSIENMSKVSTDKTRNNLIEFNENFMTNETLFGGKTTSNHIIDCAFNEKEKRRLFNIDSEAPFGFIDHVNPTKIKEFLLNENEVVAAFILNKCSEARVLEITAMLPSEKLKSIAKHLVNVKNNPCETMDKFEEQIKDILFIGETSEASKNKIQIQKASSVFETLPKDVRASIFSELESNDPETLSQIQAEMFMFEDIVLLTDVDMQNLIFEIKDMQLLATALNQSSTDLVNRFKSNFSERFETQFDTARETLMGIHDETIDQAQYKIIRTLRHLEKNNRISNLKQLKRSRQ